MRKRFGLLFMLICAMCLIAPSAALAAPWEGITIAPSDGNNEIAITVGEALDLEFTVSDVGASDWAAANPVIVRADEADEPAGFAVAAVAKEAGATVLKFTAKAAAGVFEVAKDYVITVTLTDNTAAGENNATKTKDYDIEFTVKPYTPVIAAENFPSANFFDITDAQAGDITVPVRMTGAYYPPVDKALKATLVGAGINEVDVNITNETAVDVVFTAAELKKVQIAPYPSVSYSISVAFAGDDANAEVTQVVGEIMIFDGGSAILGSVAGQMIEPDPDADEDGTLQKPFTDSISVGNGVSFVKVNGDGVNVATEGRGSSTVGSIIGGAFNADPTGTVSLSVGDNVVLIRVESHNKKNTVYYRVTVRRAAGGGSDTPSTPSTPTTPTTPTTPGTPSTEPQTDQPVPGNTDASMNKPTGTITDSNGTVHLPATEGATVTTPAAAIALPPASTIDGTTGLITVVGNTESTTATVTNTAGTAMTLPAGTTITAAGVITLPPNTGARAATSGATITLPAGTPMRTDGTISIQAPAELAARGNGTTMTLPAETEIDNTGQILLPAEVIATTSGGATIALPAGTTLPASGPANLPANQSAVVKASGAASSVSITGAVNVLSGGSGGVALGSSKITLADGTVITLTSGSIYESAVPAAAGNRTAGGGQYLVVDVSAGGAEVAYQDGTTARLEAGDKVQLNPDGKAEIVKAAASDQPGGSSGGGCNAGAFGLLALALVPLTRKRAR